MRRRTPRIQRSGCQLIAAVTRGVSSSLPHLESRQLLVGRQRQKLLEAVPFDDSPQQFGGRLIMSVLHRLRADLAFDLRQFVRNALSKHGGRDFAAIRQQVTNGLAVRMAVLYLVSRGRD